MLLPGVFISIGTSVRFGLAEWAVNSDDLSVFNAAKSHWTCDCEWVCDDQKRVLTSDRYEARKNATISKLSPYL